MAVILTEGFEGSTLVLSQKWHIRRALLDLSGPGREGGSSSDPSSTLTGYSQGRGGVTNDELIVGLGVQVKSSAAVDSFSWVGVGLGTRCQCALRITRTSTGIQAQAYRNTGGDTPVGTAAAINIAEDTWFYIEIRYLIDSAAGEVEVRINGSATPIIDIEAADGINTQGLSSTDQADTVFFMQAPGFLFDDLYALETSTASGGGGQQTFLGPQVARVMEIDATASTTGYTTVGAASANVAMADDDDATYTESNTNADEHEFSTVDISGLGTSFTAIQVDVVSRTAAVGTRDLAVKLRDAGGVSTKTAVSLTSTRSRHQAAVFTEDQGGADFDSSDVAAIQFGYVTSN